jgi:lipopolysaccharide export system permease protein
VKIISRYVLKEHVGPFVFALSALTSLLLLQYIARKFGDLVGRGLSWQVITEFMLLSIPFTIAMTLPMAVLVAVLFAFSRMASENEITALKAGGVSTRSLMRPALIASTLLAFVMLWFNDQVLSRANHELATLQIAILRTKPSFALKDQVINTVKEGQLYLRAGYIDREQSGRMRDVTIYDVTDATRRRTIYADSGVLSFAPNKKDLVMHLFKGVMISTPTNQPEQLNRIYYQQNELKVRDVANSFQSMNADTTSKGEREMSVCEMQREYENANAAMQHAHNDSLMAAWRLSKGQGKNLNPPRPPEPKIKPAGGIGALYCRMLKKYFHVQEAQAAELPRQRQDTTKRDTTKRDSTKRDTTHRDSTRQDTTKKPAAAPSGDSVTIFMGGILKKVPRNEIPPGATVIDSTRLPGVAPSTGQPATQQPILPAQQPPAAQNPAVINPAMGQPPGVSPPPTPDSVASAASQAAAELGDLKIRLEDARHRRNRYGVEIQKKFSLAAACIVFVLVGAPIALRFPRGGVGVVIGVSFLVFAVYYVGLIGGESLANNNLMSPFWAMWLDNVFFALVGLLLMARMGRESVTNRGGDLGETMDATRAWFAKQGRRIGIGRRPEPARAS